MDTICESFLEIDIDSPDRHRFSARLDQSDLGRQPSTSSRLTPRLSDVRRRGFPIPASRVTFLLQLRAGQLHFEQYGRKSQIEVGDCILIDCNAPYRLDCLNPTRSVALRFPRDWLRNWLPAPENFAGKPFRSGTGWSTALSAALANLDTDCEQELALPEGVVAEQIAALLALAAGPDARASSGGDKLLNRIRHSIRDNCHMSGLTPSDIAAANGISKRYLHYLFAHSNSTFGNELMRARLDCAHRLLSDTRYAALTVSEVAARCGFAEPSHFARRFRKAYGAGPTEYRAAQARGA